ncbi:DUF4350 domain-containing protein [Flavobacterium selenitireducens]|uniref:DUF4350 domain-containing protein n=1 Tax=Flavobacterium selenitireducens TaxID=2722704 RepID=UPI00168ADD81|nr:DUF4350 domain-containing protein [Flavobacterium selenitireducens]MBD3582663.1 DUF4350 domain-containing protein [Flavobacterium selenitireducens]
MGKLKYYIMFLVALFGLIIWLDGSQPKPIDWTPTYSAYDKIPLGLYVFNREVDQLLGTDVHRIRRSPYEFFDSIYDYGTNAYKANGNIMAISRADNLDKQSWEEIFYFVGHGNTAFVSMGTLPDIFKDSLKIEVRTKFNLRDTLRLKFKDSIFGKKTYAMHEDVMPAYFSGFDQENTEILGSFESDSLRPNFVKVYYRNGAFLLHTTPAAFTNVHLLKADHSEYAEKVLSYLPQAETYWHVSKDMSSISGSPLRFIRSQPALHWAWLIFVFGMVGFMIFNARRKQRIVPILDPLPNTTVDFAKTIGNLYFQEGDHNTVIDKKIIYFLEKIRNDYHIDTTRLDETFVVKLQQKSGKSTDDIRQAVDLINDHRRSPHLAVEGDLIKINSALEKLS